MVDESALAQAVARWRREMRLDWAGVARLAGLSRATIHNIRHGASAQSDTLRKLARAFATHPETGAFDTAVHDRALRELFQVAGFVACETAPRPDLFTTVAEVVGPERADLVGAIVRDLSLLPPHLQDRWIDMSRVAIVGLRADLRDR